MDRITIAGFGAPAPRSFTAHFTLLKAEVKRPYPRLRALLRHRFPASELIFSAEPGSWQLPTTAASLTFPLDFAIVYVLAVLQLPA